MVTITDFQAGLLAAYGAGLHLFLAYRLGYQQAAAGSVSAQEADVAEDGGGS